MKTFEGLYSKQIVRSGGAVMLFFFISDTIFQMRSVLGVAFFAALPDKYAVKWILLCLIHELFWGQILIRSRSSGSCRIDFYDRPKNIDFLSDQQPAL